MILHILGKDLRRLWACILGLTLIYFYAAQEQVAQGRFPEDNGTLRFTSFPNGDVASRFLGQGVILFNLLPIITVLSLLLFLLVILVVQLDALAGDKQDWLVRPIARRDLLIAKGLFILVIL